MFSQTNGELGFNVSFAEMLIVTAVVGVLFIVPLALLVWALSTIIPHQGLDGTSKILWVLVCIALPVIGSAAWLIAGRKKASEQAAGLMTMPGRSTSVPARTLDIATANLSPDTDEKIVIITLDAVSFEALRLIDAPVTLTSPTSRPVTFSTGVAGGNPTLDPNQGWIIPVTPATKQELNSLPAGPGEHELKTLHVAFIVE